MFENVNGIWTQIGSDIYGLQPGHGLGVSVSLSSDGKILAAGANEHPSSIGASDYTMIFENISGTWTQIGQTIYGGAKLSGRIISLSSDGNIVAIGTLNGGGNLQGYVRVYQNIANTWSQVGIHIDGEETLDLFGGSVSISGNGNKLIVGATTPTTTNLKNGYAKVYDLSGVLSTKKINAVNFNVYPNPSSDLLNISLGDNAVLENVTIYNNLGQRIKTVSRNTIDISTLTKGLYFVEVSTR